MRERCELNAGASGISRARAGDARGLRREPQPISAAMFDGKRAIGGFRRTCGNFLCREWTPSVPGFLAGRFAAGGRNTDRLAGVAVCGGDFIVERLVLRSGSGFARTVS